MATRPADGNVSRWRPPSQPDCFPSDADRERSRSARANAGADVRRSTLKMPRGQLPPQRDPDGRGHEAAGGQMPHPSHRRVLLVPAGRIGSEGLRAGLPGDVRPRPSRTAAPSAPRVALTTFSARLATRAKPTWAQPGRRGQSVGCTLLSGNCRSISVRQGSRPT